MDTSKLFYVVTHAFIGWVFCAATMGISLAVSSLDIALIIHAIAAPIIFAFVSLVYFQKFNYTTPLYTSIIFVIYVIGMDLFVVALMVNHSLEMFTSLLGTWIPLALIFVSTWLTGTLVTKTRKVDLSA